MDVKRMYCMTEKLAECAEKQFDAGIEKRNQSHTLRTKDDGHQFVAHHAHEDIQSLHPAKDACIF